MPCGPRYSLLPAFLTLGSFGQNKLVRVSDYIPKAAETALRRAGLIITGRAFAESLYPRWCKRRCRSPMLKEVRRRLSSHTEAMPKSFPAAGERPLWRHM